MHKQDPTRRVPSQVVVCSLEPWDEVWRRNQFLVRELLALEPETRVLFVEPPADLVVAIRGRQSLGSRGLRRVGERLWLLRPLKLAPRVLGPFADRSLGRQVLHAAARLSFERPVLWINDSSYVSLLGRARWPVVYDITDDWLVGSAPARHLARRRQREERLLREADAVVVCSPGLAATRGRDREVVLVQNAIDVEHFRTLRHRPNDLPPSPVAVYVGSLHEDRLDVGLCAELADRLPTVNLSLVGPSALAGESVRRLSERPNIHLLGSRPYDDIPAYLQHADVIVVPHVVNAFTESLDPIKAYECLAVSTPTVATPVAGFREFAGRLQLVQPPGFVEAVMAALDQPSREERVRALPSWRSRAERFAQVLQEVATNSPRAAQDGV